MLHKYWKREINHRLGLVSFTQRKTHSHRASQASLESAASTCCPFYRAPFSFTRSGAFIRRSAGPSRSCQETRQAGWCGRAAAFGKLFGVRSGLGLSRAPRTVSSGERRQPHLLTTLRPAIDSPWAQLVLPASSPAVPARLRDPSLPSSPVAPRCPAGEERRWRCTSPRPRALPRCSRRGRR